MSQFCLIFSNDSEFGNIYAFYVFVAFDTLFYRKKCLLHWGDKKFSALYIPTDSTDWVLSCSRVNLLTNYASEFRPGSHQMEPPRPFISWVNPFPSRFINRTTFFCNAWIAWMCLLPAVWSKAILLSFLYFHWLFPLLACETSSGNCSIYKSTRERVDSNGLYGRWRLHMMGSWFRRIKSAVELRSNVRRQSWNNNCSCGKARVAGRENDAPNLRGVRRGLCPRRASRT